jgi:hypothetical protein
VGRIRVAVATGSAAFRYRQINTAPGNFMVSCRVAIMALKTKTLHVDITTFGVKISQGIEFAVPDEIPVATGEMTIPAGFSTGLADLFCDENQVYRRFGQTCVFKVFPISPRGIMAYKTVDPGFPRSIRLSRPWVNGEGPFHSQCVLVRISSP